MTPPALTGTLPKSDGALPLHYKVQFGFGEGWGGLNQDATLMGGIRGALWLPS